MNQDIVRAIFTHFESKLAILDIECFPENTLKDEDAQPERWVEVRVSKLFKSLVSQAQVIDLAVNLVLCIKSGTSSDPNFSVYDIEGILDSMESCFTPIVIPDVGCLDFSPDSIQNIDVGRPREVSPGLTKAEITGYYKMETTK